MKKLDVCEIYRNPYQQNQSFFLVQILPFQEQIGTKSINRATSGYEQQGGKLTPRLAWLAGLELFTIPGYYGSATTENRTALKPGLQ